jgi:hypothetical protein
MATYDCLYLLGLEKSKIYFLSWFVMEKYFSDHTRPKTLDKKHHFKANFYTSKNRYCSKILLAYNMPNFICTKISKTWHLLVLVRPKYCAEKRLLKTYFAIVQKSY